MLRSLYDIQSGVRKRYLNVFFKHLTQNQAFCRREAFFGPRSAKSFRSWIPALTSTLISLLVITCKTIPKYEAYRRFPLLDVLRKFYRRAGGQLLPKLHSPTIKINCWS